MSCAQLLCLIWQTLQLTCSPVTTQSPVQPFYTFSARIRLRHSMWWTNDFSDWREGSDLFCLRLMTISTSVWFSVTASASWALTVWNCFSFQSELARCCNSTGWAGDQKPWGPGFDSTWGPLCICSASEDNLTDAAVLMWNLVSCCLAASRLGSLELTGRQRRAVSKQSCVSHWTCSDL